MREVGYDSLISTSSKEQPAGKRCEIQLQNSYLGDRRRPVVYYSCHLEAWLSSLLTSRRRSGSSEIARDANLRATIDLTLSIPDTTNRESRYFLRNAVGFAWYHERRVNLIPKLAVILFYTLCSSFVIRGMSICQNHLQDVSMCTGQQRHASWCILSRESIR